MSLHVATLRKCRPAVLEIELNVSICVFQTCLHETLKSKYAIDKDLPDELLPGLYPSLLPLGPAQSDDWLPRRSLIAYVLHIDGVVVAVVHSLLQHNVSYFDVGERMNFEKTVVLYTFTGGHLSHVSVPKMN